MCVFSVQEPSSYGSAHVLRPILVPGTRLSIRPMVLPCQNPFFLRHPSLLPPNRLVFCSFPNPNERFTKFICEIFILRLVSIRIFFSYIYIYKIIQSDLLIERVRIFNNLVKLENLKTWVITLITIYIVLIYPRNSMRGGEGEEEKKEF